MASSPSIIITVAQHCDGIWQLALPTCWPPASCSLPLPLLQSPLGNPSKRSSLPGSDWECQFFEGREREMKRHCRIVFRSRTRSPSPNQETGRQLKPSPPPTPCKVWSNEQKKFREYKLQTVEGWRTKVVSEAMGEEALLSGNICHHWLHSHQCDVFSTLYVYFIYFLFVPPPFRCWHKHQLQTGRKLECQQTVASTGILSRAHRENLFYSEKVSRRVGVIKIWVPSSKMLEVIIGILVVIILRFWSILSSWLFSTTLKNWLKIYLNKSE